LMKYAKEFKVEKKLKEYLEILLWVEKRWV
jgi:hypothetical protein